MARTTRSSSKNQTKAASTAVKKRSRPTKAVQAEVTAGAKELSAPPSKSAAPRPARRRSKFPVVFAAGLERVVKNTSELSERTRNLTQNVQFTIAPRTLSKDTIQGNRGRLGERDINDFRPDPGAVDAAVEKMRSLGFTILRRGRFSISAAGPAELVQDVMKIQLALQAMPAPSNLRATQNFTVSHDPPRPQDLFVAPVESLTVRGVVDDSIDDFVFVPPPLLFATPSSAVPPYSWHGVDGAAIRRILQVPAGLSGRGIKVALIDTGFYDHPYYAANGLDYRPISTSVAPNVTVDAVGHGTAVAYNVFATAPEVTLFGFKQGGEPQDPLELAAEEGADIISCSWGWNYEQSFGHLELTIRDLVSEGRILLFASGNGQYAWPGSMPEVLSVGGVFSGPSGDLEASNYASGYMSSRYPGRQVPDICALCGQKPGAIYVMMPCPPACTMDVANASSPFPDGDETSASDGWVGASGTSSATPQLAGIVALMIEKARNLGVTLDTATVRRLLQENSVPIARGSNAQGFAAVGHPNGAVGYGLVNAAAALAAIE